MKTENNELFVLLNLPNDGNLIIEEIKGDDKSRTISISRKAGITYCENCSTRMWSKGIYTRTVLHPVFQDKKQCILKIHQRRYRCPNCKKEMNESLPFLEKWKQSTTILPLLVLDDLKDLNHSAIDVARKYGISDSQVHDIFSAYVDLERLPLPEYISVDEVYLNISNDMKYAFVIMDFITGEIVDIVHNRWSNTLEDYFLHIPLDERKYVKAVISDGYGPYQELCDKYFPNGVQIIDSFHVMNFIINKLNLYVNSVMHSYKKKQKDLLNEKNEFANTIQKSTKDSKEIVLLRKYRWILLKNKDDIDYSYRYFYHKDLGYQTNTYKIEEEFFKLDPSFKSMRDLKELYVSFNSASYDSTDIIYHKLDEIIHTYQKSGIIQFIEFASFISTFKDNIVRSFITERVVRKSKKDQSDYYSRLSNGPMESFNRKPKDYKRNSRGFSNFDYTRNRILWANRSNPSILAVPKSNKLIHSYKLNKNTLNKRRANKLNK